MCADDRMMLEHALIGRFYEAATRVVEWTEVQSGLRELFGASGMLAGEFHLADPSRNLLWHHNADDRVLASYGRLGRRRLESPAPLSQGFPVDMPAEDRPDAVRTFRHRDDDGIHFAGAFLALAEMHWVVIGTHREASRAPFGEEEAELAGRLVPHLARALRVHRQLTLNRHDTARLHDVLALLQAGVVLLDGAGLVVWTNPAAAKQLREHPGLRLSSSRNLLALDPEQQRQLQARVRGALSMRVGAIDDDAAAVGGSVAIHHPAAMQPLLIKVIPLAHTGFSPLHFEGSVCAAMVITDPDASRTVPAGYLAEAYGLSAAETATADALLRGESVTAIARGRGVGVETVRSQLKSVFAKTGTPGQPQLVRLLMALAGEDWREGGL